MAHQAMWIFIGLYLCVYFCAGIFGHTCDKGVNHGDLISSCMTYNSLNSRQSAVGDTQRLLMSAVDRILAELDWTAITVIFDDETEIFVRSLSEALEDTRVTECRLLHVPDSLHGNNSRHFRSKLLEFYVEDTSHYKPFLVVCRGDCAVAVMEITSFCDIPLLSLLWLPGRRDWSFVGSIVGNKFLGEVFPNIRLGFNQREFIVTTRANGQYDDWDNMHRHHKYRLTEPVDATFGREKNGRWTGLVGQLVRREVDFASTGLSFTVGREAVIDYVSTPLNYDYKDIVYRKMGSDEGKWRLLLDVYSPLVLLVGLATYLIVSLLLFGLLAAPPFKTIIHSTTFSLLQESFWYMLGAIFHKGGSSLPVSLSGRILVATWWLFSIIFASVYSANLIAVFAVPKPEKPFTSLKELLGSPDYTWGLIGGGSTEGFISTSMDPDIQAFWRSIVRFNETDSSVLNGDTYLHFEKVLRGRYAVLYGHERLSKEVACQVEYLGAKLTVYSKGLALPEGSPLKVDLDNIMLNLQENGVLRLLDKKWLRNDWECGGDGRTSVSVSLVDIQSVFYALFIGLGCALLSLMLEYLAPRAGVSCTKTWNAK
ncbi:glutamate receptor ionotropic, kainate 5-like [Haliotis rufescens]|uniref:glutamate receptor ionotropic, kainate 5-like n=1 Tax=Haliotis rufescens TaxID=6454 RepID=UPI00201E952A|nr:glutamate receptor ionotropic, kainate 5-like [Haliotis rufescens]